MKRFNEKFYVFHIFDMKYGSSYTRYIEFRVNSFATDLRASVMLKIRLSFSTLDIFRQDLLVILKQML